MIKVLLSFITLFLATSASAHTGMMQSSITHNAIHIITAIGIYLAIIGAGFYVINKLPKTKRQHIKK